jgi:heterotetrameric sarcosine oxidase delta subunit
MLLIPCPWCGPRDEIEFRWSGDSHVTRPALDVSDTVWADYLFVHTNAKGPEAERWHHHAGCRQWFNLVRDTATHRIVAAYKLDESAP